VTPKGESPMTPEEKLLRAIFGEKASDVRDTSLRLPPGVNGTVVEVRVFNRHLGRDRDTSLRYAVAEDYLKAGGGQAARYAEAQNDFMWVPETEWRALVPAAPRKGDKHPVPTSFALRLFRYHLDPCRGFSESAAFTRSGADAGRLTLTVDEVDERKLRMRLEGHAKLMDPGRDEPSVYNPAILGWLEYDRAGKAFVRFDLVALGTASGLPRDANGVISFRKGPYPLGIAFELVANPTPAEHLYPRGARDNPSAYLEPKDRR